MRTFFNDKLTKHADYVLIVLNFLQEVFIKVLLQDMDLFFPFLFIVIISRIPFGFHSGRIIGDVCKVLTWVYNNVLFALKLRGQVAMDSTFSLESKFVNTLLTFLVFLLEHHACLRSSCEIKVGRRRTFKDFQFILVRFIQFSLKSCEEVGLFLPIEKLVNSVAECQAFSTGLF